MALPKFDKQFHKDNIINYMLELQKAKQIQMEMYILENKLIIDKLIKYCQDEIFKYIDKNGFCGVINISINENISDINIIKYVIRQLAILGYYSYYSLHHNNLIIINIVL